MRRSLWIVCALVTAGAFGADTPIRYRVTLPAPQTHNLEVEARIPTDGKAAIDLMMPVWIPGSYLVREFSRHVEGIAARTTDGKPLPISKTRKNRWRVDTGGAAEVVVTYRLYGREMTVDTNWIGSEFAILQGPATTRGSPARASGHTVLGSAKMVIETNQHPGLLKDMVTSPGGTAITGLHTLESGGVRTTLMDAVEAATRRSRELGQR